MIESSNLPIPISFFWYPRILYLYINIYISISYRIFRKGYILKLYNWNWKTGRLWLLCSLTFLYQAIKCPEKFIAHGYRIAHHVEASQSPTIPPIGRGWITQYDTVSIWPSQKMPLPFGRGVFVYYLLEFWGTFLPLGKGELRGID